MKLATYHDGSRDGQLVVVSRDLTQAHYASAIATRLQQVLDDWNFLSPQLHDLCVTLNHGKARHAFAFEPRRCMAPLPRAFQFVFGTAWPDRPIAAARSGSAEPLLWQGSGDTFLGPCEDARVATEDWEIDFAPGLAAVTADLPAGAAPERALDSVRLVMLANRWSLHRLLSVELARGGGAVQGAPAVAFGPVAVTPDELGAAWADGKVRLALQASRNGEQLVPAGPDTAPAADFGRLIAHLAHSRPVRAGAIVGADAGPGPGCIAALRDAQTVDGGAASTGWMRFGDAVRIELAGADGASVLGTIAQRVVGPDGAGAGPSADA
jgi:fumarylacetoacetate (FAA) hydrolase